VINGAFEFVVEAVSLSHVVTVYVMKVIEQSGVGGTLITMCLLISSTALHQLTKDGNDSARLHRFTTHIMQSALTLFSMGIGADFYLSAETVVGKIPAGVVATAMTVISLLFWYGPYFLVRGNEKNKDTEGTMNVASESVQPIAVHDKIRHSLTEARVILPGNQASLGFRFAGTSQQGFSGVGIVSNCPPAGSDVYPKIRPENRPRYSCSS
jgi:hypothetical protein